MRVATFNLRNGRAWDGWRSWPFRRRATATVLAMLAADVAALQEAFAWQQRYLLDWVPGYEARGEGRDADGGGEAAPVLWRPSRLELVEARTRWYGDTPDVPGTALPGADFPRVATVVDLVDRASGRPLRVVGTHLDAKVPALKVRSAEQLAGWVGEGPAIVLGDLNARPESEVLEVLAGAGLRRVVPEGDPGTNHGFGRHADPFRIDHVLVSGHWEIGRAEVLTARPRGRWPSDHWPVVAEVRLA